MRTKDALTIVALALLTLHTTARAETIDECQELAKQNYPLIKRYDLISQTARYTESVIKKEWLPQIEFYAQATWQNRVPELPDILTSILKQQGSEPDGAKKTQYQVGLELRQWLYDGGNRRTAQNTATAQRSVDEARNDVDMYAVRQRVSDVYFGWLLIEANLRQNAETQKSLSANLKKMEAMVRGGVAQQSDADAIKAELLMARQQQTELEAMRSVQSQVLTILCGQEINSVVMPTDIQIAEGSRPELRLLDSQTLLLTAQEKQQDASLHPRLSLFAKAYYGYMGYNLFHDMMEAEPTFNSTIGARLTWNFASIYTRSDKRRKMSLQRESIETQRSLFLFNQKMTLTEESRRESKFTQLMAEDDEIIALRTSIRKAEEAKLTAGTIDVNNLISVITRESAAIISKSIHEIELTKARYEQSLTRGE